MPAVGCLALFGRHQTAGFRQLTGDRQYAGYYDARNSLTKDSGGATIAKGNIVAALIFGRRLDY
jgi:hypothetical protein